MIVDVEVTEQDIDEGVGGNVGFCPIALAVTRAVRAMGFPELEATWEHVRAYCEPEGLIVIAKNRWSDTDPYCQLDTYDCPDEMSEFAFMFDDWYERQCMGKDDEDYLDQDGLPYERPAPFAFTLDLPLEKEWSWS